MSDTIILLSDSIDDLTFAREKSEKIVRYASDFILFEKIAGKFSRENVIISSSCLNDKIKNFIEENSGGYSVYSSLDELGEMLERASQTGGNNAGANFPREDSVSLNALSPTLANLVGNSFAMRKLRHDIAKIAQLEISVLLLGETGTGKTTVAKAIHELSPRRKKPFRSEVLSNSNETLIESKLFGVAEGGFTGAVAGKGVFEESDGGTLFLDEIGEISPNIQTKLLQVLSEGLVSRIGSNKEIPVDNRMIFATNANLDDKIREKSFREDLFYRINDVTLRIPPLRERPEDIPVIAEAFLKREKINKRFSDSALKILQTFSWRGNVRQLEKVLKTAALLYCDSDIIEPHHIRL